MDYIYYIGHLSFFRKSFNTA